MKRAFGFGAVVLITASSLFAAAQPRRPARPAPTSSEGGASPSREAAESKDGGAPGKGGGVVDQKTAGDGGSRVFRFGEVEVEGRLKSPQIVYFLRRVRAEFAAGDLGHRSFIRELDETKNEPGF